MIKLFASDLDGTLLNAAHLVDPVILSALRTVTDAGAHFAVATGRTMRSTSDFGFRGAPIEAVCSNGSIVLESRESRVIRHRDIDLSFLEELVRSFPQVIFECVGLERTYVTASYEEQQASFASDGGLASQVKMAALRFRRRRMRSECEYGCSIGDILSRDICKVNARVADPALDAELRAFLAENERTVTNAPFSPVMFRYDRGGRRQGRGARLARRLPRIAPEEVAVYGDGGNDIAMLGRFEHSSPPPTAARPPSAPRAPSSAAARSMPFPGTWSRPCGARGSTPASTDAARGGAQAPPFFTCARYMPVDL